MSSRPESLELASKPILALSAREPTTGFKTVSGAGPAREQPHFVLGPKSTCHERRPCGALRGVPGARLLRAGVQVGRPRSRSSAIGFETSLVSIQRKHDQEDGQRCPSTGCGACADG